MISLRKLAVIVTLIAIAGPAMANDNMNCLGVREAMGPFASEADSGKGVLPLEPIAKKISGAIFAETKKKELQRLSVLYMGATIPSNDGETRSGNLRSDTELAYQKDGRLNRLSLKTYEDGKPKEILMGKDTEFKWVGSTCRPEKISVQNKLQLGDKRGVVFDSKLCQALMGGEKGVTLKRAEACVDASRKAITAVADYDKKLRAASDDKEFLVTANPFQAGSVVPSVKLPKNSQALTLMSSCADYARAGQSASAKPSAASQAADQAESALDNTSAK